MIAIYWFFLMVISCAFISGCDLSFDEPRAAMLSQNETDEPPPEAPDEDTEGETVIVHHNRCDEVKALFMDYGVELICWE